MTSLMRAEARAIPEAVAAALGRQQATLVDIVDRLRAFEPRGLVTIGHGSSAHAAAYGMRLIGNELGLLGGPLPLSLVNWDATPLRFEGQLVLAISQSGMSPDLVDATTAARAGGALTLALVNTSESPLAAASELVLTADAGPERAIAATKSYVCTLVQLARLVAHWRPNPALGDALDGLPAVLDRALATDASAALTVLSGASSLFVAGRGLAHATALEVALKLKEAAGLHAEGLGSAELMHGPKTLIGATSPLLMFTAPELPIEADLISARTLAELTSGLVVAGAHDLGVGHRLEVPTAGHAFLQPGVDATASYILAVALAEARGRSPDAPPHLHKVTRTR